MSNLINQLDDERYLTEQIITYIGNKRALLDEINNMIMVVKQELGKEKMVTCDIFSGSGIVARLLKQHSSTVIANDLEDYSYLINSCYLANKDEIDFDLYDKVLNDLNSAYEKEKVSGIITNNYAPKDEVNITKTDRVFYTRENAQIIDTYRKNIDELVPEGLRKFFLTRLVTEASIHTNTSGVFKGFYKDKETGIGKYGGSGENALTRIKGKIELSRPILSNFSSDYILYKRDANELVKELKEIDLTYCDSPYDQHPYGSNYFMLNLIIKNEMPETISKVSGIPTDWNRSAYNVKKKAFAAMEDLICSLDSKYVLLSYNNEGFIGFNEMTDMLRKYGDLRVKQIKYNAFRGSRNLNGRDLYTNEYLFLLRRK